MPTDKTIVWLCDLTHTFQTVAMNRIPLGIGMVASYTVRVLGDRVLPRLFKFPDKVSEALRDDQAPFIVGFANYVWNQNINFELARRIKESLPKTIIVFGGPNFSDDKEWRLQFFQRAPWVDFFLPHEGEMAFATLTKLLLKHNGDVEHVKELAPSNTVFVRNGQLIAGKPNQRIDISEVPSPYLNGMLDDFFKTLKPLVQMTRGCPFSCTYCTEGMPYWNKVSRQMPEAVARELEYVAEHCDTAEDLFIADSNFGMYVQDINNCKVIAEMQDRFSWPQYVNVATGKNKKERIIEASRTIRGALRLSASVQSTDPVVLRNVRRHNISIEQTLELGKAAGETGANTYSELILSLPGDSLHAHFKSLQDVLDAGLNTVRPFTLMLLQGTDLASRKSREEHQMLTKFRVLPRCFGKYSWLDRNEILTAEIEEVCVGNATLSFEDYLECRSFHLTVEIFYNDGILADLYAILAASGVSTYEFLRSVHASVSKSEMREVYDEFMRETREELWDSPEEILKFIRQPGILEKYQQGEYGANLLFKYKTLSFIKYIETVYDLAFALAEAMIHERCEEAIEDMPWIFDFLGQLIRFYRYRTVNFLDTEQTFEDCFDYDISGFIAGTTPLGEVLGPKRSMRFAHSPEQKEVIELNKKIFGEDLIGLSRLLSQVYIKRCFRTPVVLPENTGTSGEGARA